MYIKTGEKRNVKCVRVVRPKILNHGSNALMKLSIAQGLRSYKFETAVLVQSWKLSNFEPHQHLHG